MKTVFSNKHDLAHAYAHATAPRGRSNAIFFERDIIYSYGHHFPIAAKHDGKLIFTTRDYSNSTAKHKSVVLSACSQYERIYCFNPESAIKGDHAPNIDNFEKRAEIIAGKLTRARKPEIYLNQIAQERAALEKYAEHFNVDLSQYALNFINIKATGEQIAAAEKREQIAKEQEQKRQAKLLKERKEQIKKFRAFKTDYVYSRIDRDFLRVNTEKNRIETSQRVEIPLEAARRLYSWIKQTAECLDGCGQTLLNYNVTELTRKYVKIGCHTIYRDEITRVAKFLNW
jgi:hypothetical protein